MLEIDDVRKSYDAVEALRGVSLRAGAGEIVAVLGPNGAGKTTLISLVAGLMRPSGGSVRIDGLDPVADAHVLRRRTGLAAQDVALYPILSVAANLAFFAELHGLRRARRDRRIAQVADALALAPLLERPVRSLSGGERRRVHVACALLHEPALLLVDEPTAGVDVETRARLLAHVRDLADRGVTICYSSHYLEEVEALRAYVVVLDRGRAIASAPLDELVRSVGSPLVELTFDSPAPLIALGEDVEVDGNVLRIRARDTTAVAARALELVSQEGHALRNLAIVEPSLEAVYVALAGRRYDDAAGMNGAATGERESA